MEANLENRRSNRPVEPVPPVPAKSGAGRALVLLAIVILAALAVVAGLLWKRARAYRQLAEVTRTMSIPNVVVTRAKAGPDTVEIELPANLTAYSDATLYARTSGYVKSWHPDLGARVKKGELMAEISAPEVDAQLLQATANLAQAKATLENTQLDFNRAKELVKTRAISQQEFDKTRTGHEAAAAAVQAAEAAVENLRVQQGFQKVVAPFDGVVTSRTVDVGTLINAGNSGSGGQELFRIARTDLLRAYVSVPQIYSPNISVNTPAYLELGEFPGRKFSGKVTHVSGAIDPATRTLLTEIQIPNPDGQLFAGALGRMHLSIKLKSVPEVVPINALLFRSEGSQVGVVDDANVVHLKKVTFGRDFGTAIEINSGLKPGDRIILNPPDSISDGSEVRVQPQALPETAEGKAGEK